MIKTIMKTVTNIDYRKFGLPFIVVATFVALFLVAPSSPVSVDAQTVTPITGWAWSSNIGHIRFDHGRTNPVIMDANGNLSGYAWTSNIGWINFNPISGYPVAESEHGVQLNKTTGVVNGWGRVISQIGQNA